MNYVDLVIEAFWQYHISFAAIVAPLIGMFLVYRLIKGRIK